MTQITTDVGPQKKTSEHSKDLLISWELRGNHKTTESKINLNGDQCDQALSEASEYIEHLTDSQGERTSRNSDIQKCPLPKNLQDSSTPHIAYRGKSAILCNIRQIVLVTMYQFLNSHGLKACHKLLV